MHCTNLHINLFVQDFVRKNLLILIKFSLNLRLNFLREARCELFEKRSSIMCGAA